MQDENIVPGTGDAGDDAGAASLPGTAGVPSYPSEFLHDPNKLVEAFTKTSCFRHSLFSVAPSDAEAARYRQEAEAWLDVYKENPSDDLALVQFGKAHYGLGEIDKALLAYSAFLDHHLDGELTAPAYKESVVKVLKLRAEVYGEMLKVLREGAEGATEEEKARIPELIKGYEKAIQRDRVMAMALNFTGEREQLAKLEASLAELKDTPVEERREVLRRIEGLADDYLAVGSTEYGKNSRDTMLVRKRMSALASEAYGILARATAADADTGISCTSGLYRAKALLAAGEIEEAEKVLRFYCDHDGGVDGGRSEMTPAFLESHKLLEKLQGVRLRAANLLALEGIERHLEGNEAVDEMKSDHAAQVATFAEVRRLLEGGEVQTVRDALKQISETGSEELRACAGKLYNESERRTYRVDYEPDDMVPSLIHLTAHWPIDEGDARHVLRIAKGMAKIDFRVEAAFIASRLVEDCCGEQETLDLARAVEHEAGREKGILDIAYAAYTTTTAEEFYFNVLSEYYWMKAIGLAGKMAELRTLMRLQQAAKASRRAIALSLAVGSVVEGGLFATKGIAASVIIHGADKTFTPEHMALTYAATVLSVGGCKFGGEAGSVLGPRATRALGLVAQGGRELSTGGKVVSWGIGHGMGFGGLVAGSSATRLLPGEHGAWGESLAQDAYFYVLYSTAQHALPHGGAFERRVSSDLAMTKAAVNAESQLARMGVRSKGRVKDGEVVVWHEGKLTTVASDKVPEGGQVVLKAGEPIFKSERDLGLYYQLRNVSMTHAGFNGDKFTKLVASGRTDLTGKYLHDFGLKLVTRDGKVEGIVQMSEHEKLGVHAPRKLSASARRRLLELALAPASLMLGAGGGGAGGGIEGRETKGKTGSPPSGTKGPLGTFTGWNNLGIRTEAGGSLRESMMHDGFSTRLNEFVREIASQIGQGKLNFKGIMDAVASARVRLSEELGEKSNNLLGHIGRARGPDLTSVMSHYEGFVESGLLKLFGGLQSMGVNHPLLQQGDMMDISYSDTRRVDGKTGVFPCYKASVFPKRTIPGTDIVMNLTLMMFNLKPADGSMEIGPPETHGPAKTEGNFKAEGAWIHSFEIEHFPLIIDHLDGLSRKIASPETPEAEVIRSVAEIHWWMAQMSPYERGSASIADGITKAILYAKGIYPGRWKPGISPDIKAFEMPLEEYVEAYPTFFE